MERNLLKQLFTSFYTTGLEGDERQVQETNKIIASGMFGLISTLIIFFIVTETLDIRFGIHIPFSMSDQLIFIIGVICFICSIYLCRNGLIAGVTSFTILFSGIVFPSFLLSRLPLIIFEGYEKVTSLVSLFLIPLIILFSYVLFNYLFQINSFNED